MRRLDVLVVMTGVVYVRCKRTLCFNARANRRGVHAGVTSVDGTRALSWMVVTGTSHAVVYASRSPDSLGGIFSFAGEIASHPRTECSQRVAQALLAKTLHDLRARRVLPEHVSHLLDHSVEAAIIGNRHHFEYILRGKKVLFRVGSTSEDGLKASARETRVLQTMRRRRAGIAQRSRPCYAGKSNRKV